MKNALLLLVAVLLTACPTLKLGGVTVSDGSVSATSLTLKAAVVVEETEEVSADAGSMNEGRGLLAVYLPVGWSVAAGRMKSPQESVPRSITPVPQIAVQFGETFPTVPGQWWAFASNTQGVPTGSWTHEVELDITFPKKSKAAEIGVSVGVFNDNLDEVPSPVVFDLTIKGKKATLKARAFKAPPLPGPDPAAGNTDKASAG